MERYQTTFAWFFAVICVLGLTACSKDDSDTPEIDENTVSTTIGNLQFSFTEQEFGVEQDLQPKASKASRAVKSQKLDLGDDLAADITVEEEAPVASTRASKPLSNGTYSVIAYKTDGTRYGGVLLKGTVAGGVFTAAPGFHEKMNLPDGETLTFVCFNDKVTDDGTNLTVTASDVATALVGTTTLTLTTDRRHTVAFTMKHPGARIRTKIIAMMGIGADIKATFATPSVKIPTNACYHASNQDYVATATDNFQKVIAYPKADWDWAKYYNNPDLTANTACAYQYILPHTSISAFKLSFTAGKLYLKEFSGKTLSFSDPIEAEANKSYCINITVKFKGFKFLYHDGTAGRLNDPAVAGKTPIAIVVKENDGTPNSGLAMALHEFNGYGWTWNYGGYLEHTKQCTTTEQMKQDFDGYNYTYNPSYSRYGIAHSADPQFPAFQAVANYEPAVASLKQDFKKGHWFMPSSGEWLLMGTNLGFAEYAEYTTTLDSRRYYAFISKAMAQVGGTDIYSESDTYRFYWSSTEKDEWYIGMSSVTKMSIGTGFIFDAKGSGTSNSYVRPFIHF
ncbi:MAG: hypothetical protein ACTTK2_07005 [Hoylesella marshii]|uniref:hypothetical protein n=1 Tax=Hoylesella marshii TaxID=189722 RepID=UPI003F9F3598